MLRLWNRVTFAWVVASAWDHRTKLPWIPSFEEILHAACWFQHNRRLSIETIHLFNFHFIGYLLYYRVSTRCLERDESD